MQEFDFLSIVRIVHIFASTEKTAGISLWPTSIFLAKLFTSSEAVLRLSQKCFSADKKC